MKRTLTLSFLLAGVGQAVACGAVVVEWSDTGFTLDNGLVRLQIDSGGALRWLSQAREENLLANGGQGYWNAHCDNAKQTRGFVAPRGPGRIVRQTAGLVEVAFRHEPYGRWPREAFPFDAHLHYVLRNGEPGFYLFMTLGHGEEMPAATAAQYAYNLRLDPQRFDYLAADERRRHISHTCQQEKNAQSVMDATFRLADGRVVSKYDYCLDIADDEYHAYGWVSTREGVGVWLIQPSAEYYSCTPFRQFLSAHQTSTTPIIIWQPQCTHYGGTPIAVEEGEPWRKLYGPLFFYLNSGDDTDSLWRDANRRAVDVAKRWPYRWMAHDWFAVDRGRVTGQLQFTGGQPARDARVILSPTGTPWWREWKGYHFWARTDAAGRFVVEHVRPGTYSLVATGADQFEEYHSPQAVSVAADQTVAMGALEWKPVVRGRRLWQIGVADRSPGEFRNGDDFRHWGMWRRYPTDFPKGVRFVVGESHERTDWNFAHWSWHSGDDPAWRIEFDLPKPPAGQAHLTFGIAASAGYSAGSKRMHPRAETDVRVAVNGQEIGALKLPNSGGAGHRSGRQTTRYSVATLSFDASLLTGGTNEIALRHATSHRYATGDAMGESGPGPGYVMYDAIRLELAAKQ